MNRNQLGRAVGLAVALTAGLARAQAFPTPAAPDVAAGPQSQPSTGQTVGSGNTTTPGGAPGGAVQGGPSAGEAVEEGPAIPGVPSTVAKKELPKEPLTLEELMARARRSDARVAEAEAELNRLRGLQQQAHWAWFPQFATTLGFGGPIPEAKNDGLGGPPTTPASFSGDWNFGHVGFTVFLESTAVLPIYTFGKLTALKEAGDRGPIIGAALRDRAQDEAGFQAAQAFYGYQLARSGLQQIEDVSKRLDDASKRIDELVEQDSPQVSKMDAYKVRYFQQVVVARRAEILQGRDLALQAIRLLAGAKQDETLAVVELDLPLEEDVKVPTLEQAMVTAKRCRPEFKAIQAGLEARAREVFIRERSFYPDFGLAGFLTLRYTSNTTPQRSYFAYDPYNDRTGGVGLVVRQTFDFPIKDAVLQQSRAELAKLQAQSVLLDAAIRLEVSKVHGELEAALTRAQAFSEAQKNARRWANVAYTAFDVGTGGTRDLVEGFSAYAEASAGASKSWHDVRVGLAALSRVMGTPTKRCE